MSFTSRPYWALESHTGHDEWKTLRIELTDGVSGLLQQQLFACMDGRLRVYVISITALAEITIFEANG